MTAHAGPGTIGLDPLDRNDTTAAPDRAEFSGLPAAQQPEWPDHRQLRDALRSLPDRDLVTREDVASLRGRLAALGTDGGLILQIGDCVEDIDGDAVAATRNQLAFFDRARDHLRGRTGRDVTLVGRIAGQYAKPRSQEYEVIDGVRLPSYRGPVVNAPWPTAEARRPHPARIIRAHAAALTALEAVREHRRGGGSPVWTSHEMLLLDYELRFLRRRPDGNHLATTHWPWIGARTNRHDGAHAAVAATLGNPVSAKIGPGTPPEEAARLAALLNPGDEPGRLTLIARMGHRGIDRLGPIVRAVHRRTEHVHWISDPMHGNTVTSASGLKTRHVEHVVEECARFQEILLREGRRPAGIHLEATHEDVHECTENGREPRDRSRYRTLLDPRLNPGQTARVLDAWSR
ncbi:3-deoxy-7-phosphoheptulonate synthase [Nocardiopsis flavescens]|uniref:3-deoxy-7-phosphoheptulonate synthase n=1 Tax=Nocardiopsis flavescens TaxID=758803 RepID=UPI003655684D